MKKVVVDAVSACAELIARGKGPESAGRRLGRIARQARIERDMPTLRAASTLMLNPELPRRVRNMGWCYQASCLRADGRIEDSRVLLDGLVDKLDSEHKPRAILSLAYSYQSVGDLTMASALRLEAYRAARGIDCLTQFQSLYMLAAGWAAADEHKRALDQLERMRSIANLIRPYQPAVYVDYLNSLACELGALGLTDQANAAIDYVLRSPYVANFPNWIETKEEIKLQRPRVFVPFSIWIGYPSEHLDKAHPAATAPGAVAPHPESAQGERSARSIPSPDGFAQQRRSRKRMGLGSRTVRQALPHIRAAKPHENAPFAVYLRHSKITGEVTGSPKASLPFELLKAEAGFLVSAPSRAPPSKESI